MTAGVALTDADRAPWLARIADWLTGATDGIPDDEVRDFRATAFGAAGGLGMREILGYAPIEPDGSVQIKVPAGVPFAIGVLDVDGRRITPRHANWMQLRAGQVLSCNGCHVPAGAQPGAPPAISHGRQGLTASVNAGAPTTASIGPSQAVVQGDYLYVANFSANSVGVYDLRMGAYGALIREVELVGENPHTLSISPDGRFLAVANYVGELDGLHVNSTLTVLDADPSSATWLEPLARIVNQ